MTESITAFFTKIGSKQRELFFEGKMNVLKNCSGGISHSPTQKMLMTSCCLLIEFARAKLLPVHHAREWRLRFNKSCSLPLNSVWIKEKSWEWMNSWRRRALWIKQRWTLRKQIHQPSGTASTEKTHWHESSSKHSSKPAVALPILWQHTKVWAGCTLDSCRGTLVIGLGAFSASWLGRCQHSHGMIRDWDPTTVWYGQNLGSKLNRI